MTHPVTMSETQLSVLEQSEYADQVVSVGKVTLGEKDRDNMKDKKRKNKQKERILEAVGALMNSGGGIVCIDIENQNYNYDMESLGLDLETDLKQLVHPLATEDYFVFKQQGITLWIFVKSWSSDGNLARLCCGDTGLRERSQTTVSCIANGAVMEFLKKKKRKLHEGHIRKKRRSHSGNSAAMAQQLYARDKVEIGEELQFGESVNVEFKSFTAEKNLDKRLKETIPRYASAFANTQGGYLFIGIDDKTKKVVGCGHGFSGDRLKSTVEEISKKLLSVHASGCGQSNNWSVEVHILKVLKGEDDQGCYVVAIHIPEHCCTVFEKDPDCWQIKNRKICPVKAEDWLKEIQDTDPGGDLCTKFNRVLNIAASPPKSKPVYGFKEEQLSELQQKRFPVNGPGITTVPELLKKHFFEEYPELENVLTAGAGQGALILSRSWAVDIGMPKNKEVIYEALLICERAPPTLYCMVGTGSPALWEHARVVALNLKQKLVNVGGNREWVCVNPQLVNCKTASLIPRDQGTVGTVAGPQYPGCYKLDSIEVVRALLQALVIVVMSFTSALSNQLGLNFLNLLTIEQSDILQSKYDIEHIKELFVHGCPGTGKTVIATLIMKRIKNTFGCETRNILYICENAPLKQSIERENICQSVTRSTFMKFDFPDVEHIIVDEAQNFRIEDGMWYEKAKKMVEQKNGVFWIFLDYCQQSHTESVGLPVPRSQRHKTFLTKIVRNSVVVHEKISKTLEKIREAEQNTDRQELMYEIIKKIECTHNFQGTYEEFLTSEQTILNQLVSVVRKCLKGGNAPCAIAVLCSTNEEAEKCKENLERILNCPVVSAEKIDTNSIVVDSVRRFSGLERDIVILFNLTVHRIQKEIGPHFSISAISRARAELYVLLTCKLGLRTRSRHPISF